MKALKYLSLMLAIIGGLGVLAGLVLTVYYVFAAAAEPGYSSTLTNLSGAALAMAAISALVGVVGLAVFVELDS